MAPYLYLTSSFITDSTSFCSISSFISLYGITLPAIPTGRFLGETMKGSVSSSLLPKLFAARIRRISSISHLDRYALNAGNPCSGATSIAILFISTICLFYFFSITHRVKPDHIIFCKKEPVHPEILVHYYSSLRL